jgi:chromosome segregation protein
MQAIVVETDANAAAAIEFLKKQRLGRATFLPLNKMAPGRPAGRPLMAVRDADALGFAIDLIKFDEKYRNAFWYVFRDTVIVKDLTAARKLMGGVRLVTLDGDLIDAGGAMTGGAEDARDRLKFGERAKDELEKLAVRLRAAIQSQETLVEQLGKVRESISVIDGKLRDATLGEQARQEKVAQLAERRKEAQIKFTATESELDALERELKTIDRDLADCDTKSDAAAKELARLETEREQKSKLLLASTRKDLAEEMTRLQAAVEDSRGRLRDAESALVTVTRELEIVEAQRASLAAKIAEASEKIEANAAAVADFETAVAKAEKDLKVLLEVEAAQNDALKSLSQKRDRALEKKSDLAQKQARLRTEMGTTNDIAIREKGRIPALEAEINELGQELAALSVRAPEEFPETLDDLKGAQRRLEGQLERLGNVNLLAIEEFEKQASRKGDLASEIQRLEAQQADLVRLVEEIVARKKEGFFKVFHEINKNFGDVFGRLSDGGKAELILENAEQPFEGGLFLRAQPKGKKLTRLEALSGGEKSLTSMAFIFAIQEYDPSPFYYLDEIDQNLDGINADLLAKLVKRNSKHAQFIVVSLRKVTLVQANHVFGVTMQENGLSEIVGEIHINEIADEPARPAAPLIIGGN